MKMEHGLRTLALKLSLLLICFLLIPLANSKTLQVDTVTPSVTDGDFTITPNGTGDIVFGTFSGVLKASSGVLSVSNVDLASEVTGVLPIANGGTGAADGVLTTTGDILYYNAGWARLPIGTVNQLLTSNGTQVSWQNPPVSTTVSDKADIQTHDGTSNASLAVGTDGQILSANSAELTGLEWISVPVATTLTTKGDIQVFDTANARLPVGADGSYLVADSAETTGLKWDNFLTGTLNPVTDWESFTPTGDWTSNVTYTGKYKIVGDTAHFQVNILLSGAPDGTLNFIDIPFTIDTTKLSSGASVYATVIGQTRISDSGGSTYVGNVRYGSATTIRPLFFNTSAQEAAISSTTPVTFASGDIVNITFSVPIVGYSSGVDAVVQNKKIRSVRARKTSLQTLADGVLETIVYDDELEDDHSLYNNSTGVFTCPEAGAKFRVGFNVYLEDLDNNSSSIQLINVVSSSGDTYELARLGDIGANTSRNMSAAPFDFECASDSEEWTFNALCEEIDNTTCRTRASSGTNYYNSLSITELPQNFALAGTFGDCQTKYLSADVTTDTVDISDLNFDSSLKVGNNYMVILTNRIQISATALDNIILTANHDSSVVCEANGSGTTNGQSPTFERTCLFTATTTDLTIDVASIGVSNALRGNGTITGTSAILCDLKKDIQ